MPSLLPNEQFSLHLFDSANGKSVAVQRVVDVSDVCQPGSICILLYGEVVKGPLVQILQPYTRKDLMLGAVTHYFLEHIERELLPKNRSALPRIAAELGLLPLQFISLLRNPLLKKE